MKTPFEQQVEKQASKLVFDIGLKRARQFAADYAQTVAVSGDETDDETETFTFWCEVRDLIGDWQAERDQLRAEGR